MTEILLGQPSKLTSEAFLVASLRRTGESVHAQAHCMAKLSRASGWHVNSKDMRLQTGICATFEVLADAHGGEREGSRGRAGHVRDPLASPREHGLGKGPSLAVLCVHPSRIAVDHGLICIPGLHICRHEVFNVRQAVFGLGAAKNGRTNGQLRLARLSRHPRKLVLCRGMHYAGED